jgi:hypothetical protein
MAPQSDVTSASSRFHFVRMTSFSMKEFATDAANAQKKRSTQSYVRKPW